MYTEQNIRGLAINFLRQHYKLRPRSGTSGTRVVHKPHYYEGVTIDARLAYQKPDLSWFTATVEASGVEQAHELLYRVNYFRIVVHALLVTLGILTLYLAGTQVRGKSLWEQFGRPEVYFYLLNIFLVVFAVAGVLLSRLRYYRYIYAIAQFMRFHADAQWIAYDRHIFDNVPDRYYRELQRQCLRFGFGLMEIQDDNKVRWLIEPSHIDQFQGQRSRLPVWVAAAAKAPPLLKNFRLPLKKASPAPAAAPPSPAAVPTDGLTDPLDVGSYLPMHVRKDDYAATIVPPTKGRKPWYKQPTRLVSRLRWRVRNAVRSLYPREIRRRPGFYELPLGVVALGFSLLLALGGLIWLQSEWTPERRPGQVASAPDLAPLESAATPEQSDADPEVLTGEYDHELSGKEFAEREDEIDISSSEAPSIVEAASTDPKTIRYFRYAPGGTVESSYGCGPLGRADALGFVLLEGRYPVYETALERAAYLNGQYEIPAAVLLADCLREGAPGYLLYVGPPVKTEAEANLTLRQFLRDYDLLVEVLEV